MGFILFILSLLLSAIFLVVGFIYGLVSCFIQVRWKTGIRNADKNFMTLAKSVDKFGNVVCGPLFNVTLIKKESPYRFGKIEQTISMVLGYNQLHGGLNSFGWWWVRLLDKLDEDHCIKAIEKVSDKHFKNNQQ